jgi:hypothetical protein
MEITPLLNVAEQKHSRDIYGFSNFRGISNVSFIFPRFLAEPLTMAYGTLGFRGTPVGKSCHNQYISVRFQVLSAASVQMAVFWVVEL